MPLEPNLATVARGDRRRRPRDDGRRAARATVPHLARAPRGAAGAGRDGPRPRAARGDARSHPPTDADPVVAATAAASAAIRQRRRADGRRRRHAGRRPVVSRPPPGRRAAAGRDPAPVEPVPGPRGPRRAAVRRGSRQSRCPLPSARVGGGAASRSRARSSSACSRSGSCWASPGTSRLPRGEVLDAAGHAGSARTATRAVLLPRTARRPTSPAAPIAIEPTPDGVATPTDRVTEGRRRPTRGPDRHRHADGSPDPPADDAPHPRRAPPDRGRSDGPAARSDPIRIPRPGRRPGRRPARRPADAGPDAAAHRPAEPAAAGLVRLQRERPARSRSRTTPRAPTTGSGTSATARPRPPASRATPTRPPARTR